MFSIPGSLREKSHHVHSLQFSKRRTVLTNLVVLCMRTTEESYVTLYTEVPSVELTRNEVCDKFRAWARSSVQGQCVEIALSKRDRETSSSARMMYRMYCTSCNLCSAGSGCRGRGTYDGNELQIRGLPLSSHGEFDKRYGSRHNALTSSEKQKIKENRSEGRFTIARVMDAFAEGEQDTLPRMFVQQQQQQRQQETTATTTTTIAFLGL